MWLLEQADAAAVLPEIVLAVLSMALLMFGVFRKDDAADSVTIDIEGVGSHAGRPHLGIDTVLVAAQIINNIQSIASRNVDPLKAAVVSITGTV